MSSNSNNEIKINDHVGEFTSSIKETVQFKVCEGCFKQFDTPNLDPMCDDCFQQGSELTGNQPCAHVTI